MTTWTKFSERLPEETMPNVFLKWPDASAVTTSNRAKNERWADYGKIMGGVPDLLWHPITYPELPKEPTQLDKDRNAMFACYAGKSLDNGFQVSRNKEVDKQYYDGWLDALACERAEVAKLVAGIPCPHASVSGPYGALRKRCGLDK